MVYNWSKFSQIILPSRCPLCTRAAGPAGFCPDCLGALPYLDHACRRCGTPLPAHLAGCVCGECLKRPPHYDHCRALLRYEPPVDQLIRRLKFHQDLAAAAALGELMSARLLSTPGPLPQALVPVPLHPRRQRLRGYNQALELARPLARALALPLDNRLCVRTRHTAEQSHLKPEQRRRNLHRAFALTGPAGYDHVALIDDVVTTGHTVNALARVLKRGGVRRVDVWCCCRAGPE